ncbi:hypothetical protein P8452_35194 [Trifolium repens]|nr:hypothetical protein P8452_35194 [Trifolium repens]
MTRIVLIPFLIGEIMIKYLTPCCTLYHKCRVRDLNLNFSDPKWDKKNSGDHDALFQLPSIVYELGSLLKLLKLYLVQFCSLVRNKQTKTLWEQSLCLRSTKHLHYFWALANNDNK